MKQRKKLSRLYHEISSKFRDIMDLGKAAISKEEGGDQLEEKPGISK